MLCTVQYLNTSDALNNDIIKLDLVQSVTFVNTSLVYLYASSIFAYTKYLAHNLNVIKIRFCHWTKVITRGVARSLNMLKLIQI